MLLSLMLFCLIFKITKLDDTKSTILFRLMVISDDPLYLKYGEKLHTQLKDSESMTQRN
jgi:hypothetical protein